MAKIDWVTLSDISTELNVITLTSKQEMALSVAEIERFNKIVNNIWNELNKLRAIATDARVRFDRSR